MIQNDPKCSKSWQQISQPERLSGHQHVAFPSPQPAANPQKQQCVRCAILCTIWDCPNMRNAPKLLFSNVRLILFEWENDDLQVPNFGTRPSGAGLSWVLEVKWKLWGHRHLCFCFRKLLQMFSFCLVCSVWAKMKQPPLQMNQTSYQRMLLHPDDGW